MQGRENLPVLRMGCMQAHTEKKGGRQCAVDCLPLFEAALAFYLGMK